MTASRRGLTRIPSGCAGAGLVIALVLAWPAAAAAQTPSGRGQGAGGPAGALSPNVEPSDQPYRLTYFNRYIVTLRARVLGRNPDLRAQGVVRALDELVGVGITGPVTTRQFEGGVLTAVGSRPVMALTSLDVDELSGETVEGAANAAADRLRLALDEVAEARLPGLLLRQSGIAAVGLSVGLLALWALVRVERATVRKMDEIAERRLTQAGIADVTALRGSRLLDFQRGVAHLVFACVGLVVIYATLTFVLRRFPYTRPWGESMTGYLVASVENLGLGMAHAVPGLFTVALICVIVRFIGRLLRLWFDGIQSGRIRSRLIYPETAQPTRRLLAGLLWVFAAVTSYPYLPGSQTDAFKGISVFLGLMVTFGSSGLMNQIVSGFVLTYSRALRVGDFVQVGDVLGTVTHLGVLSTKIRTPWREEVTVPNAVLIGQTTTDYTRPSQTDDGVFTPTSVTIGYDAPWRQVEALLVLAAERTPGLRRERKPIVVQTALQDFYVHYTLLVCLERQESRPFTLHALHANIQDLFNEHGVQIMSPNYMLDPGKPKVVARQDWFAAPARPERQDAGSR